MHLALLEAAALLFAGYREPELEQVGTVPYHHAFELGRLTHELLVFGVAAKAHDAFDAGTVVPGAVEQHDFAGGGQVLYITLEIPLAAFEFRGFFQRDNACAARIDVFHEALDGAALAGGIAPLEDDNDALPGFFHPGLQLEKLDLQAIFLPLVVAAHHQVLVRVAAVAPAGRQFMVGIDPRLFDGQLLFLEQAAQQAARLLFAGTRNDVAHR